MDQTAPVGLLTRRGSSEIAGHIAEIDHDSLDTVTLALYLGLKTLHLVAVERVRDILDQSLAMIRDVNR